MSPSRFCSRRLGSVPGLADNGFVKATLEAINNMQTDGVITRYAIGGAVGATFYLEPAATLNLDTFVELPGESSGPLVSLPPIYKHLKMRGGKVKDEYIVIGGWPVQFILPSDELQREAIELAVETVVEGVTTRVMRAEHLIAIALRVGRPKDHTRILQFLEQECVDRGKLENILERSGLRPMARVRTQIFGRNEMSKPKLRSRLTALSFTEKIKILEKLRDRSEKIAASGLRKSSSQNYKKSDRKVQ